MEVPFFEKHAARIQTQRTTVLNKICSFEIDSVDKLLLYTPNTMTCQTFTYLLTAVWNFFRALDLILSNPGPNK